MLVSLLTRPVNNTHIIIDRGAIVGVLDWAFGQTQEDRAEDEADRKAHEEQVKKLEKEALARAREQRDYERKMAAERLQKALDEEGKMALALNNAYKELSDSKFQLKQAKDNLAKTKSDLELLSNKVIELVSTFLSERIDAWCRSNTYDLNFTARNHENPRQLYPRAIDPQGTDRASG